MLTTPKRETIVNLSEGKTPLEWQPRQTTTIDEVVFLSPLDHVSARGRAKELFNFDYIWEIYKPAAKRKYGPYTMPILYGDQLVARIDAKLEREHQSLIINGIWLEEWFNPPDSFGVALAKGLDNLAKFLGVKQLNTTTISPNSLRLNVNEYLNRDRGFAP